MKIRSEKSKILFINPPAMVDLKIHKGLKYPPMGIVFLSAFIRDHGYLAKVFDGTNIGYSIPTITICSESKE